MAVPTPRATSTSATTPIRTTVLRRTVITRESLLTTEANGSSACWRSDKSRGAGSGRWPVQGGLDSATMGRARPDVQLTCTSLLEHTSKTTMFKRPEGRARRPSHLCGNSCILVMSSSEEWAGGDKGRNVTIHSEVVPGTDLANAAAPDPFGKAGVSDRPGCVPGSVAMARNIDVRR